ncbi:hypothetical protein EK21DRAFT_99940 [Setomelanomma holmii]|uniref:DUF4211 domain-containing protein n=1 Tax=Setomelanomma holmii TaxID=210430 RepID=A0A9P4HCH8_9PLEO|nr:hypothetical protein EK21DRAFT_99940 [Setomelanomma holmii]
MPVSTENGIFGSSDAEKPPSETSEDEDADHQVKAKLATRKRRRDEDRSESDDNSPKVIVFRAKRQRRRSPEVEQSEDKKLRLPQRKRVKVIKREPTPDDDDDEEDDDEDSEESAEHTPPHVDEDEQSPPPSRRRRRRLAKRPAMSSEDEDDDEAPEEESESDNNEEREDLQEDLAFLRSSPLPDRGMLRITHDKPKSERQRALEALKKRRAGTNEPSSSATPVRSRRVVVESESESESDFELEIIKEEPESDVEVITDLEEEEEDDEVQESDRDANALDMFLEDEQDQGFIDDEEGVIGEPVLNPDDFMPLIIARLSSEKPKALFKYAIEWMVMKKIHPGFDSNSEVYDITFRKLDDEVKGLANSKFSSSAWTADFTRAIRARPDLEEMEIIAIKKDTMDLHCQACNRKNHPATWELMLRGRPYNKVTLEPLDNDSDSDSNSDDDSELSADSEEELNGEKAARNSNGERLPPESHRFALGKTCKANAHVAHTLHHWRYHLYSWVKDYLAREGHLTAEKLVQRDGWSDKKREKAARKIVKAMEENGEIRKLYHAYKDQVSYAVDVRHDLDRWGRR